MINLLILQPPHVLVYHEIKSLAGMNEFKILQQIKEQYPDVYDGYYPFPAPYRGNKTIKAIMLGTDPGNLFSGSTVRIPVVFGLSTPGSPYFRTIQENIDQLNDLEIDNLYIQNVCRSYFLFSSP